MFLITQFWEFDDDARKKEVLDCLIKNAKNRSIKKIYVFHEPGSELSLTHNKIVNLKSKHKLSYLDMMHYARKVSTTTPFIIANADIHFDNLNKLNGYKYDNSVIALSSYWNNEITDFSFDSFIFKPNITDRINFNTYSPGVSHDDLRFLRCLIKSDIEVRNPSLDIKSIHLDYKRKLKSDIKEVFDYIEPSKVNSTIITIKNNHKSIKEEFKFEKLNDLPVDKYKEASYDEYVKGYIDDKKNIVVILHLYYQDMWDEIKDQLDNIKVGFDLYVTMVNKSSTIGQMDWMINKIKNDYPSARVYILPNKGLDIGPYLYCLDQIFRTNKNYKYLLKIHTKKSIKTSGLEGGETWRNDLIRPLIGSETQFENNINIFENNTQIGMIGSNKWITKHLLTNRETIDYYKKELGITHASEFIGGTIFFVRFELMKTYFEYKSMKIYDELEVGYFTDHKLPTKTHALERIMGYLVTDSKKKIYGI